MAKLREYVMGEEEANTMEASEPKEQQPAKEAAHDESDDVADEKNVIPVPESECFLSGSLDLYRMSFFTFVLFYTLE